MLNGFSVSKVSMLQKPSFTSDAQIIATLYKGYGLSINMLSFVPLGEASWCYKAIDTDENIWFIKILRHKLHVLSVSIPEFLRDELGYRFVIPPIHNKQGLLWDNVEEHDLMVYPYLQGKTVMDDASFEQWQEVGHIFALLHQTPLPADVEKMLHVENFIPPWGQEAKSVIAYAATSGLIGASYELARFIQSKEQEIQAILARTEELGSLLREEKPKLVLCHADPNAANIFITDNNELVLIDWDGVMFAPRERDLMFFTGSEKELFMSGYDKTQQLRINALAIAYYKYEWVVQEIGDYGTQIFFNDTDDVTKQRALQEFYKLFVPDDVVQDAYASDADLTV